MIARRTILSLSLLVTFVAGAGSVRFMKAASTVQTSSSNQQEDWLLEAKQAERSGNFSRAAECYINYLKGHPQDAEVHQRLGLVYYLSNRFAEAIPVFQRALKLDQTQWGSALFLGICLYRVGQFKKAVEPLHFALKLKPDLPEGHFWLGSTLLALGKTEEAISQLQMVSAGSSVSLEANALLVRAYREAADSYYQRIEKLDPNSYRTHQLQAETLIWRDRDTEAVQEYRKALAEKANIEGVHRAIGNLYWQGREFERARPEYEAELRSFPLDEEANVRLGQYWLVKGDAGRAERFLDTVLLVDKSSAEAHRDLAQIWLLRGDNAKAESFLKSALRESSDDPLTHRLLAELYERTGKLDLAKQEKDIAQKLSSTGRKEEETPPRKTGKPESQ